MKTLALIILTIINLNTFSQIKPNMVTITIEKEDGINVLSWESQKEINTSYYIIEKSINGSDFEILGTQKAGSSTYHNTNYSFEDVEDVDQDLTYKITLVLMDGTTVAAIKDQKNDDNLTKVFVK